MNEHEQQAGEPTSNQRGFEDESAPQAATAGPAPKAGKVKSAAELKANFNSVFGHGLGKASLVLVVVFLVIAVAFAIRGLNRPAVVQKSARVDVPDAPVASINIDAIDSKEAERRAQVATLEAEAAVKQGSTYQPGFNPIIATTQPQAQPVATIAPPLPPPGSMPVQMVVPGPSGQSGGGASQAVTAEEQRRQADLDKQTAVREKYVDQLRSGVEAQADELLSGKGKDGGMSGRGTYSMLSYMPALKTGQGQAGATQQGGQGMSVPGAFGEGSGGPKKTIFKAGKTIFATLDAQVNTDDGGEVFATVRGGKYDGAKLIGKIEMAPRNIRLKFNLLAPQDERPTMSINAVAIREDDARQGVAEVIDHHTLERYTALFAGSVLTGIGKAAAQPQGDTVVLPSGQVVVSNPELSNKRIAMFALGEIGLNAGAEIRKNFSQPPTYMTPANKGIGLIFLTDVFEK